MRRAFVLQLSPDTDPDRGLDGWIEEVDTGCDLRFHSTEELLRFLRRCFELSRNRDRKGPEDIGATSRS
jgi:hypothetical protein